MLMWRMPVSPPTRSGWCGGLRVVVHRWPRFAQWLDATTFCAGLGRMWAERGTRIAIAGEVAVEATALWVHLDPDSRRPAPFSPEEQAMYEASPELRGRRISAKLRHPAPQPGATESSWSFRRVDCDIAEHVNNAAYWLPMEEELLSAEGEPAGLDAELEFRAGAQPGPVRVLAADTMRWLLDANGTLLASARLAPPAAA